MRADTAAAREELATRLSRQAAGCASLGSPFYADLLSRAVEDLKGEGAVWDVLRGFASEPSDSALGLRLLGAVHRLVLTGQLPAAARHYPSVGGDGDADAAWPVFREALERDGDRIRELAAAPCQTNEVGRSAALFGGFLEVARRTRLPLRILEIGASAGLILRWDRYRYEAGGQAWGDPDSPVRFTSHFEKPPALDTPARVVERAGCDLDPIEPTTDEGSLTLRSFTWPDQLERIRLLEAAIEVAREVPVTVERMAAPAFLERELARPRPGMATVVYHSVFMQYLDAATRERLRDVIGRAIAHGTRQAPVAYLTFEPAAEGLPFEIRLDAELLGVARAHGTGVRWLRLPARSADHRGRMTT